MAILKIFLLFLLIEMTFSAKNKINNIKNNKINLRSLNMIQNIPVDNNIPIIIQDVNNNNPNHINNPIPFQIPMFPNLNNNSIHIITNTSIKINSTKKDPMCTHECCAGCKVQFQKLILQKNCIINICKCKIIENNIENKNETIGQIKKEESLLLLMDTNNIFNNSENSSSYSYYLFVLFIFVIYEIYIIYRLNHKGMQLSSDIEPIKKDKEARIKDYMDLLYDDDELIECFI